MQKQKIYTVTGRTSPLVDGLGRDITLVAILRTEEQVKPIYTQTKKIEGKKTTTTTVETLTVTNTRTTLSFGLAVLSPTDIELQKQSDADWNAAYDKWLLDVAANPKAVKPRKKANIVSAERGIAIATGKALKETSALATFVTNDIFLTTGMIKAMLGEKLNHITSDPDRFIRIAPLRGAGTPSEKVIQSVQNTPQVEQPVQKSSTYA